MKSKSLLSSDPLSRSHAMSSVISPEDRPQGASKTFQASPRQVWLVRGEADRKSSNQQLLIRLEQGAEDLQAWGSCSLEMGGNSPAGVFRPRRAQGKAKLKSVFLGRLESSINKVSDYRWAVSVFQTCSLFHFFLSPSEILSTFAFILIKGFKN